MDRYIKNTDELYLLKLSVIAVIIWVSNRKHWPSIQKYLFISKIHKTDLWVWLKASWEVIKIQTLTIIGKLISVSIQ